MRRNVDCVYDLSASDVNLPNTTSTSSGRFHYYADDFTQHGNTSGDISNHFPGVGSYLLYSDNAFDLNLDWIFSTDLDPESNLVSHGSIYPSTQVVQQPEVNRSNRERHLLHDSNTLSLPIPDAVERFDPDDAMVGHAAPLTAFSLPQLVGYGEIEDYSPFYLTKPFATSTRALMESWLRMPLEQKLWDTVSLQAFPSKERLDQCVDLYFAQFDQHCPVVHRPTFDPAREPAVTLAMVTLGACFTSFEGGQAFSNALSELVRRLLVFMPEKDPRFVRTEYYVTAQLLQTVHGFFCGNRRLFELAESSRALLINHGRRMGLFNQRESSCPPECSLEERWHSWIRDERFRLLGWAIYVGSFHLPPVIQTNSNFPRDVTLRLAICLMSNLKSPCPRPIWIYRFLADIGRLLLHMPGPPYIHGRKPRKTYYFNHFYSHCSRILKQCSPSSKMNTT